MNGSVLEFCIIFTLLLYMIYQWKFSDTFRKAKYLKSFPGPKALPIIGNGHQMLIKPTEFYSWSWALCKTWGGDVLTWRLNFPILWISNFETAKQLLANPKFNAKSQDVDMFWRWPGGNGLSSSPAHIHSKRRKLLYPGYTRKVVDRSIYIFCEETKRLVEKLRHLADSQEIFEILEWAMPCSFRIICRSAFGDNLISEQTDDEARNQTNALHKIGRNMLARMRSPFLWNRNDFIYFSLTSEGREARECGKIINDFGTMVINKRRENWDEYFCNTDKENLCYLDMLLDFCNRGDLKKIDVLGELNNYIVAGYDTTALTVAWTLFALTLHDPCHQQKIADELNEIFEGAPIQDWNITAADIKRMKYMELCVKEALRLFPTSPVLPRSTTVDVKLKDERVIPSGTDVFIMVDMIHRDPRYFKDPDKFLPERHLEPNPAFIPFSAGVRTCVGQVYAMHQVKVELAGLLREYIWETVDEEDTLLRGFEALMVPVDGIRFKIKKRSN